MDNKSPDFETWKETVHTTLKKDPLWKFQVYPKALFAYDLAWDDCEYLLKDVRGKAIAEQLIRSVGSISANIDEGFGRLIPSDILDHRLSLLSDIIAMIAPNITKQRNYKQK